MMALGRAHEYRVSFVPFVNVYTYTDPLRRIYQYS